MEDHSSMICVPATNLQASCMSCVGVSSQNTTRKKAKQNVDHLLVRQIIHCPLCDLWEVSKRPNSFKACSQEAPVKLLNRCCDAIGCPPVCLAPKCCHIEPSKFTIRVQEAADKGFGLTLVSVADWLTLRNRWRQFLLRPRASTCLHQHGLFTRPIWRSRGPGQIIRYFNWAMGCIVCGATPGRFPSTSWPALMLTHPPIQLVQRAVCLRVKRTGR